MFDTNTRVRINDNYVINTEHGKTGTVKGYYLGYVLVDIDFGNSHPDRADLFHERELDILEDTDVHI